MEATITPSKFPPRGPAKPMCPSGTVRTAFFLPPIQVSQLGVRPLLEFTMMKVFEAQHHAEAHFVQGLLQAAGIGAEVRGESLFTTVEGGSAVPGMRPSVWILEDSQREQARGIVVAFAAGEGVPKYSEGPWRCSTCGEIHEPQFASCWKCGTAIHTVPNPAP